MLLDRIILVFQNFTFDKSMEDNTLSMHLYFFYCYCSCVYGSNACLSYMLNDAGYYFIRVSLYKLSFEIFPIFFVSYFL